MIFNQRGKNEKGNRNNSFFGNPFTSGRQNIGNIHRVCRELFGKSADIIGREWFAFGGPITNHRIFVLFVASYLALC